MFSPTIRRPLAWVFMKVIPEASTLKKEKKVTEIREHIVEIVSDSGEGAQTAGQMFGTINAKMGNGVWTVEIIPAEIEPPKRSKAGASGIRIRLGEKQVTNAGNKANIVIGFNEQVLYSRIDTQSFQEGTIIFLDKKWTESPIEGIRKAYTEAVADFKKRKYEIIEIPLEEECLKVVPDPRRGKNMWVMGMLCELYQRDVSLVEKEIVKKFKRKGQKVIDSNLKLLRSGFEWAEENLEFIYSLSAVDDGVPKVVMNGNQAIGLGAMAAGMELCSMYPITPATSVTHYMASVFKEVGGFVHQAEDEIAAIGFAIGASYAGKTALTVTSGPGMALKTEMIALAVMAEVPLVVVDVQRGGPSTGLPTKVEQADLLSTLYGSPGDAPKIIIAPSTIEECFHFMVSARKLAEMYRGPVFVLTDANLATGVQPYPKPTLKEEWLSPPLDQSRWDKNIDPYQWDPETGVSPRPIPGQKDGNYVLTGLAHNSRSKVAYESETNQKSTAMRSRKLATLQKSLKPPVVNGDESGDLLIVAWGSTRGAIEEAVEVSRAEGKSVSSLHLKFLSPLEPGLKDIFKKFKRVMTIEINYSDDMNDPFYNEDNMRYAQLATVLRSHTLVDVKSWSRVPGFPLQPETIHQIIIEEIAKIGGAK
ncbi:MAG: 2-oxoglutarate oxidoreductase [Acidobacteria bacterium]|nr:MAG: 2-oxoglutarate oxidoreductase [Acidobacteriota bacterium]